MHHTQAGTDKARLFLPISAGQSGGETEEQRDRVGKGEMDRAGIEKYKQSRQGQWRAEVHGACPPPRSKFIPLLLPDHPT